MSETVKVFFAKSLKTEISANVLESLKKDFIEYKSGNSLPDTIGRDVLYDHPSNPQSVIDGEVSHIHIAKFEVWEEQYNRTSDKHLVYCPAAMTEGYYLFIALLNPEAHNLAKDSAIMRTFGVIAENFRNKY